MFLRDENIVVNSIDDLAPRWVPVLKRFGWRSPSSFSPSSRGKAGIAARDAIAFNDVTADLGLSRGLHWIALLVGVIGAASRRSPWACAGNGQR